MSIKPQLRFSILYDPRNVTRHSRLSSKTLKGDYVNVKVDDGGMRATEKKTARATDLGDIFLIFKLGHLYVATFEIALFLWIFM